MSLFTLRRKPTKQGSEEFGKVAIPLMKKLGVEALVNYWTLGRYDAVAIYEAPDEKTMMKFLVAVPEDMESETLVAVKEYEELLEMSLLPTYEKLKNEIPSRAARELASNGPKVFEVEPEKYGENLGSLD